MRIRSLAAALAAPALVAVLALPASADPIAEIAESDVPALAENARDGETTGRRRGKCKGKKGRRNGEARTGDAGELRDGKRRRKRGRKGRRGRRNRQSDAE